MQFRFTNLQCVSCTGGALGDTPSAFVADGNSITAGQGVATPYTGLMALNLLWNISNLGVPGETLTTMIANAPANVYPKLISKQKNIVVLEGGENDLVGGQTPTQVYNSMVTYCTNLKAAVTGAKCLVWTVLSRVGLDTQKNSVNALILADTTHFDGVVNFTGTPLGVDGGYANTTYFQSDQIHPTQFAVTTIEAPSVSAVVNMLP